jgi:uncharacterized membrane protein
MSRGWSIALWLLLAVSLFGNAVAVGFTLRLAEVRDVLQGESAGMRDLPPDLRSSIRQRVINARGEFREKLQALGEARGRMIAAAKAEPYDAAALEAAMADVRAATTEVQLLTQSLLKAAVEARSD